jgi:hypothetical protein
MRTAVDGLSLDVAYALDLNKSPLRVHDDELHGI